jgi:hypothetical protein
MPMLRGMATDGEAIPLTSARHAVESDGPPHTLVAVLPNRQETARLRKQWERGDPPCS